MKDKKTKELSPIGGDWGAMMLNAMWAPRWDPGPGKGQSVQKWVEFQ